MDTIISSRSRKTKFLPFRIVTPLQHGPSSFVCPSLSWNLERQLSFFDPGVGFAAHDYYLEDN